MGYRYLQMDTYRRRAHFEYFRTLAYPYVGVTANVEITAFMEKIRGEARPFFLTFCYCVSRAANGVAEFRQRIVDEQIVEFDRCSTSHTVALEDGTYCYCSLDSTLPFDEYIPYAAAEQERARQKRSLSDDDALDKFFISTLPWLSYTALIQPVPMPADSNPRITWGKYSDQGGRILLPVSVLCHHALVDGIHIARFYELLDRELRQISGL